MQRALYKSEKSSKRKSSRSLTRMKNSDEELTMEFLRQIMPKSVPDQALQAELARLRQNSILTLGDLSDLCPQELEKIVRPVTARTLLQFLPPLASPSPPFSPHVSNDRDSPLLFRNRLRLRIGSLGRSRSDEGEKPEYSSPSPLLRVRRLVNSHPGSEDTDTELTASVLQNLMPFAGHETVQNDFSKLTAAGILRLDEIARRPSAELAEILGPTTANSLQQTIRDSARSASLQCASAPNTPPPRYLRIKNQSTETLPKFVFPPQSNLID